MTFEQIMFLFVSVVMISILTLAYWSYFHATVLFISFERMSNFDCIITVCNRKKKIFKYRGSCTVWFDVETGERAGLERESFLSGIYERRKYKEEYEL